MPVVEITFQPRTAGYRHADRFGRLFAYDPYQLTAAESWEEATTGHELESRGFRRSAYAMRDGSGGLGSDAKTKEDVIITASRRIRGSPAAQIVAVPLSDHPRRARLPTESCPPVHL